VYAGGAGVAGGCATGVDGVQGAIGVAAVIADTLTVPPSIVLIAVRNFSVRPPSLAVKAA
jgi:hypothetical protein